MTVLLVCWLHPFAGTSRSRRRTRFIPTPASAGRASPIRPQSARPVWQQRPVRDHQRPPAHGDLRKTIAPQSRCRLKSPSPANCSPLSRGFLHRRLSDAGPLHWVDRSRWAGIRNPSRNQPFACHGSNESNRSKAAVTRMRGNPVRVRTRRGDGVVSGGIPRLSLDDAQRDFGRRPATLIPSARPAIPVR
jgi:hypothetical protein